MELEYKQFDFDESLRELDLALLPEQDELSPKNQFLPIIDTSGVECAYAGVISVCVRLMAYDNSNLSGLGIAYELVKRMMLDIFRDNSDCIDIICMGRYFCGIFNAPVKSNIDVLIETMSRLNAALSVLDIKLNKRFKIKVQGNIGCDYGELFRLYKVTQNGNEKINESWHGAPLNMAILYSEKDINNEQNGTIISEVIKSNLKDDYAKFFSKYDDKFCGYWASLVDSNMFEWVKKNR